MPAAHKRSRHAVHTYMFICQHSIYGTHLPSVACISLLISNQADSLRPPDQRLWLPQHGLPWQQPARSAVHCHSCTWAVRAVTTADTWGLTGACGTAHQPGTCKSRMYMTEARIAAAAGWLQPLAVQSQLKASAKRNQPLRCKALLLGVGAIKAAGAIEQ